MKYDLDPSNYEGLEAEMVERLAELTAHIADPEEVGDEVDRMLQELSDHGCPGMPSLAGHLCHTHQIMEFYEKHEDAILDKLEEVQWADDTSEGLLLLTTLAQNRTWAAWELLAGSFVPGEDGEDEEDCE